LNQFNKDAIERKEELLASIKNSLTPAPENESEENTDDTNDSLSANVQPSDVILPTTKYILETNDLKTGVTETQELNPPGYLVGLTRAQVVEYLTDYMNDLPLSEHNKGLISYELLTFSPDEIKIRKSYDADNISFMFYVAVKNGYVVVYNSDLKSIYSYTSIEAKNLPEKDRINLSQGIYIDSVEELYGLLESYSS
jgi:hypothetical protein